MAPKRQQSRSEKQWHICGVRSTTPYVACAISRCTDFFCFPTEKTTNKMALTPAEYRTRISRLHASYKNRTRFPDWCTGEKYLDLHDKFCRTARLVAPQDQKRQARLSIYQRQPVNIMMNTSGTNWKAFKQLQKNLPNKLGWGCPSDWENSYYTTGV